MSHNPEKDALVAHLERLADEWDRPVEGRQEYAALALQCAADEIRALIADNEWANRAWKPSDGDTKCQECSRPNGAWFADNEIWNAVMSDRVAEWLDGAVIGGGDPGGCLCPPCFIRRADAAGIHTVWRLIPEWSGRALLMDDHPAQSPAIPPALSEAWEEGLNAGLGLAERGYASPNPYRALPPGVTGE